MIRHSHQASVVVVNVFHSWLCLDSAARANVKTAKMKSQVEAAYTLEVYCADCDLFIGERDGFRATLSVSECSFARVQDFVDAVPFLGLGCAVSWFFFKNAAQLDLVSSSRHPFRNNAKKWI